MDGRAWSDLASCRMLVTGPSPGRSQEGVLAAKVARASHFVESSIGHRMRLISSVPILRRDVAGGPSWFFARLRSY
jgi:hypothetical protein